MSSEHAKELLWDIHAIRSGGQQIAKAWHKFVENLLPMQEISDSTNKTSAIFDHAPAASLVTDDIGAVGKRS